MDDTRKDANGNYTSAAFLGYKCTGILFEVTRGLNTKEMFRVFQTCKDIRLNSILDAWGPDLCNSKAIEFAKKYAKESKKQSCVQKRLLKKIGIISLIAISLSVILLIVNLFIPQFYISGKMWLWSLLAYVLITFAITVTDTVDYIMIKYEINSILENVNLFAFSKWSRRTI